MKIAPIYVVSDGCGGHCSRTAAERGVQVFAEIPGVRDDQMGLCEKCYCGGVVTCLFGPNHESVIAV